MMEVVLKPRKARPFYGRHPWVLDSAIDRVEGGPADGDVVDLLSDKGKFIARGIFNGQSRIRVRLYTWDAAEMLDEAFWRRRIESAIGFRRQLGYDEPSGAARLIFSEGDGLSGLIVDRYADYLAMQVTALAMAVRLPQIVPMLVELTNPRGIVIRTERGVSKAEGLDLRDGPYWGQMPDGPLLIVDQGLTYELDLAEGQKTGFYLDQRENRVAAARYFRDRRVLDMFCYSGGFAMAASALGGAREVLGVDTSQKAVDAGQIQCRAKRTEERRLRVRRRLQDARIADRGRRTLRRRGARSAQVRPQPPRRRRSHAGLPLAQSPRRVALFEPGGILVTCSCSGHVSREDFLYMLVGVAQQTGREIQVLEQRGALPDHPDQRLLPRKRISEVLHLPRGIKFIDGNRSLASPSRV